MLDVLKELTRQVPNAVAVIFVVIVFINYINKSEERREKNETEREERAERAEAARLQVTKNIGESCHVFQREMSARQDLHNTRMTEAINENTKAMARNTMALDRDDRRRNKQT